MALRSTWCAVARWAGLRWRRRVMRSLAGSLMPSHGVLARSTGARRIIWGSRAALTLTGRQRHTKRTSCCVRV